MRKLRITKKWKRLSAYKKSLILLSLVLVILSTVFLVYVYNSMILYERHLVDNYISYLAESGKLTEGVNDNMFTISKFESSNAKITDGIKKLYKSDNLKIKKNSELSKGDIYAYDLYNDSKLISTVSLKSTKSYKKMAILTINEWEIVDSKNYFDNGVYAYEITVPNDYKVYINSYLLDDSDITKSGDVAGLENLTKYVEISKSKTYNVNNLVYEPKIKIVDASNKEVKFDIKDNQINITKKFQEFAALEESKTYIKDDFDVLKLAENWSLFLTKDLRGTNYGLSTLMPYLISGSKMYQRAYDWSHGIDITFVSNHRLKSPTFTNESVSDCVIYNDNAFSCLVSLEKNMVVNGNDKVDKMHDRLYFIYYNGGYKLVDMQAVKE